ncbi:hypothetical protein [Desertivirga arenae]|uniref:hypothetical protein n=1 Tax=Desertivirga arenae TaxID=2810309 RepID=UPI001A97C5E2|nr:hypothetical protein [Pedobacter sp. SYSU D00823]
MSHVSEVIHGHVASHIFEDDGQFPNNPNLPALVYKGALHLHPGDESQAIVERFKLNNWTNSWKDGIFDYHHYHSNTHEVLGVFCGMADIELGGKEGVCVEIVRGDVVIIPAGVAHKCLKSSDDFLCIGAYPDGSSYDLLKGEPAEHERALANISQVPIPSTDPIFGEEGPLFEYWKK